MDKNAFERSCKYSLYPDRVDLRKFSRRHVGEFSQLAIIGQFQRRAGDQKQRRWNLSWLVLLTAPAQSHLLCRSLTPERPANCAWHKVNNWNLGG